MLKQIFIGDAFAQVSEVAATPAAPENSFTSFIPLVLIFAIFYFLIVRPQSKKMKEHQALINNLKIGNKVITSGGIVGLTVTRHLSHALARSFIIMSIFGE